MADKPSLYLDTSVPSVYVARPSNDLVVAGHQHITHRWWEECIGDYNVYVSHLVHEEAKRGDPDAVVRRLEAIRTFPMLQATRAAIGLAKIYLKELPLPSSAEADAMHLALATTNGMDFLLTWNCRHLARGSVIRALPAINDQRELVTPTICTPEELLYEDQAEMD